MAKKSQTQVGNGQSLWQSKFLTAEGKAQHGTPFSQVRKFSKRFRKQFKMSKEVHEIIKSVGGLDDYSIAAMTPEEQRKVHAWLDVAESIAR